MAIVGHFQVHQVVDKAHQPAHRFGIVEGFRVGPGDVLDEVPTLPQRPVVRDAFVGAAGRRIAGLEEIGPDILARQGYDPDIGPGAIAFTPDVVAGRTTGFAGWFVKRQGWLFFPLLMLEGQNLHAASIRAALDTSSTPAVVSTDSGTSLWAVGSDLLVGKHVISLSADN